MLEQIYKLLIDCDLNGLVSIYEKQLKPVMYNIGDLWAQGKFDIATEHEISN